LKKQAIIFDHDGTLIDSFDAVTYCSNLVVTEAGYREIDDDQIRQGMAYPTYERFSYHTGEKEPEKLSKMARNFYIFMNREGVDRVRIYPGIREALDRLAREGFSLGILTNNQGIFTRRVAAHLKYSYDLEVMLGEDNVPAPKPDPRGALQACAGLGALPENTWYVGDARPDFEVARNAGMKSGIVTWGAHSMEELQTLGADKYFEKAHDLADFFCG